MGSVIATWSGQFSADATRLELLTYVRRIAALSHGFFESEPALVVRDDAVEGKVLLDTGLLPLREAGSHPWPPADCGATLVDDDGSRPPLLALERVRLQGVEFRLFDPRDLYKDNRVSFVSVNWPEQPRLHGLLVMVEDAGECNRYIDQRVHGADWYLAQPGVHLRYFLERWLDLLMAWVREYFMPDLRYWRYKHGPGVSDLANLLREWETTLDREQQRDCLFDELLKAFKLEVEQWKSR